MRIPQLDLKPSVAEERADILAAIDRVLSSGEFILGPEVEAFEQDFARLVGARYCVGVSSGTAGIELAIRASGIPPYSGVAVPAHTASATVAAVLNAGCVPIFVDVCSNSCTIDPASLEEASKRAEMSGVKTAAVVVVHLYGQPAALDEVVAFASRRGAVVVEDCAQACGAAYRGRSVGTFGHISVFSFYPTKNLAALGDAGAIVTDDKEYAGRAQQLRQYGWPVTGTRISRTLGTNSRMDSMQAAILRARLPLLSSHNARRRQIASAYSMRLVDCDIHVPVPSQLTEHVYHQYVIRSPRRDELQSHLASLGIGSAIHYAPPLHDQPAYRDAALRFVPLPVTESLSREVLSLPMYPDLSDDDARVVSDGVLAFFR